MPLSFTKEVYVRSRKLWHNGQIAQAKRERHTAERKWIKTNVPDGHLKYARLKFFKMQTIVPLYYNDIIL